MEEARGLEHDGKPCRARDRRPYEEAEGEMRKKRK